jgi:hypothetical protein
MKYIILIIALSLTGCASLDYAGSSAYQIRQVIDANGKTGFDITVKNGKEIALVKAHLEKKGEDFSVDLEEQGVAAFAGQQISADAMKIGMEQAAKAAVAAAIAYGSAGVVPIIGDALNGSGLGAAVVGAGGALAVQKALAKPDPAPVAP